MPEPAHAPEAGPEAQVAALSTVAVRALIVAITHRKMYPPEHPIASRALTSWMLETILS